MIFEELGKVANVKWGDTSVTKKSYVESGYRAFSATGADGFLPDFDFDETGIVLSAIGARCGKCFKATGRWKAIKNTITITSNEKIDGVDIDYLYYITNDENFWPKRGVAQPFIGLGDARKVKIPLPPLSVQKRIAGILDAADGLRAKRRAALAQLDTLLQSTFLDLFGDPVTNPKGWDKICVGDQIDFLTSGSRGWAKYYAEEGDIFIRIQNLKKGVLDLTDIAFVNAPESAEARRTRVKEGDVLLSITADLGRTAVVPRGISRAHINQHLAILRFRSLNPIFVSHQFATHGGQAQFAKLNREGVKAGLNFNDVKQLTLIAPPLDLQRRFAMIVESVERQKARHRKHLAQLDTLFASLQQRAFKGEL